MFEVILCFVLLIFALYYLYEAIKRPVGFPPGPLWLPIVGNLPLIKKLAKTHGSQFKTFEKLCEEYKSPVIGLKLGKELAIFCMTYPILHAAHTHEAFDGRPDTFFLRLRCMGTRLGVTCTDGPLWTQQRNFIIRHLRLAGYGRSSMEDQLQLELTEILELLENLNGDPIWPGKFLPPSVINSIWIFTAGKRISRNDPRLTNLLVLFEKRSRAFDISGGTLNHYPWLRFIAPEKSGYNLIREINKELKELFMEVINEHYKNYADHKSSDDLIYAYIAEMINRKDEKDSNFNDMQLTMIILDIFIAGSQSTSTTLDLALMMMVYDNEIQSKVYNEINSVLGDENPKLETKKQLPYTQAVLMEVQRFFHIVPVSGPRRVLAETTLGGYRIPKNTTVLFGLESVHKDKDYWGDPETFRPERFLSADGKTICNTERLMPFGLGRRKCLGEILARACIHIYFVGILQKYKLVLPKTSEKPSLKLLPGIILSPKPYKIQFLKR